MVDIIWNEAHFLHLYKGKHYLQLISINSNIYCLLKLAKFNYFLIPVSIKSVSVVIKGLLITEWIYNRKVLYQMTCINLN